MRKKLTAQLLALSTALALPGLAAAQFPYSAWDCGRADNKCSPALIPAPGEAISWGDSPDWPGFPGAAPGFSDATLNSFEKAFAEVETISQDFTKELPEDATAEDTKTLRDQAHEKALAALKSANIERSEYNRVAAFMNRDLDLRMQVMGGDS